MAVIPTFVSQDMFPGLMEQYNPGGIVQLAGISTTQQNYDIGLNLARNYNQLPLSVFLVTPTANVAIGGIVAPTDTSRFILLFNNSGIGSTPFTITLNNADAGSAAANQFAVTLGGNRVIPAQTYALLRYDAAAAIWSVAFLIPSNAAKIAVPGNADGIFVALDCAFWSCHNTGLYDAAGVRTANAIDVFYQYSTSTAAMTLLYTSGDLAAIQSIPIEAGRDEIIQVKRGAPFMRFVVASGANPVVLRFRKNEQGHGLNMQG